MTVQEQEMMDILFPLNCNNKKLRYAFQKGVEVARNNCQKEIYDACLSIIEYYRTLQKIRDFNSLELTELSTILQNTFNIRLPQ